jgi:Fusaric acid resistance protein-like
VTNVTKSATDRRGGFGSFVATLPRAAVSAGAATLPAILGAYLDQVSFGFTASFGAYLVAITHPSLPAQGGAQRLAATVLMLSLGAVAGAASAMQVWAFVPLAVVCATWQAWAELADSGLRLPAAMSVLASLLSAGNVSSHVAAVTFGAAFASGAVWQGLVQCIAARTSSMPKALLAVDSAVLPSSIAAAPRFIGTMAALGFVGGAIAASLPVPHAGWLLTAALRVMKPTQAQTLLRLKQRLTGTIGGAVFAAGLLCWPLPALLHAGALGIILTLMQLVGAKRYAVWTFCLTVIALDLKSVLPQEIGWRLGEERILLTIGGLALAILFSLRLPQSGWSADFGSSACTTQCAPADPPGTYRADDAKRD